MEHRRVCFRMLSLLPLVQISKLSQANSLLFGKVCCRTPRGVRGLKCLASSCALLPICTSHPSRGAWIEIQRAVFCQDTEKSHPSRGAWIEIGQQWESGSRCGSHPSRGAWIEIVRNTTSPSIPGISRTPHGVRGLKSAAGPRPHGVCLSHPSRVRGLNCLTGAPGQFAGDAA